MEDRKIHLKCECGHAIDYLAQRYTLHLQPRCRRCNGQMKPCHEDMTANDRALDFSRDAVGTGIRLSRSPSDRIVVR